MKADEENRAGDESYELNSVNKTIDQEVAYLDKSQQS
jgi:hypothetical protein